MIEFETLCNVHPLGLSNVQTSRLEPRGPFGNFLPVVIRVFT
jgi:hypothetical protein